MNSAPEADWKLVDQNLRRLAREVAQRDSEIGYWLLAAEETKPWLKGGMRSIYEYVEHLFGWTPHTITERIRTAKALLLLPQLDAELAAGSMNWSVVRELTRVATAATESAWIEFARGKTVRAVEKKVAKHAQGETPSDPGDISRVRKRMYFCFSADQFAVVAASIARLRKHDATLTDEEAVTMMASSAFQSATATPAGETPRRPFRLQVEIGLDGSSFLKGVGEERLEISPALAECAQCDAEVWIRRPDGRVERVRVAVPQPMRRRLYERAEGCCEVCGIRLEPQLHHLWLLSEGGKHDVDQMIVLCKAHHDRVHEGSLWILGSRARGFRFTMADGTPYGSGAPSSRAVTNIDAFQVLRRLGYKEKEIRPVLEVLMARDFSLEDLLVEALRLLCPTWDAKKKRPAAPKPARASNAEATPAAEKTAPASPAHTAEDTTQVVRAARPAEDYASSTESPNRPTWDRPHVRKYPMRPPENGGVGERTIGYRATTRRVGRNPSRRLSVRLSGVAHWRTPRVRSQHISSPALRLAFESVGDPPR